MCPILRQTSKLNFLFTPFFVLQYFHQINNTYISSMLVKSFVSIQRQLRSLKKLGGSEHHIQNIENQLMLCVTVNLKCPHHQNFHFPI